MSKRTFGQAIAAARQAKHMTQFEIAEAMDVTDKAVSAWERGVASPDINSFSKLASILDVSADELLALPRPSASSTRRREDISEILHVTLMAIGMAMGVVVFILSILEKADVRLVGILLGIGLFCIALFLLDKHTDS